jgi:hypothetical protein
VDRAGQRAGDPQDVTVRGGDDLQVHPVAFVLAGAGRPVAGNPVDRDEGAVDDHIGVTCPFGVPDRLAEFRRPGGEEVGDLVNVAPRCGPANAEPGRELVERVAFAQVGQDKHRLLTRAQLPPPRPDRLQVPADDPGGEVEGLRRQRQRGTVKQHVEAPGVGGEMW